MLARSRFLSPAMLGLWCSLTALSVLLACGGESDSTGQTSGNAGGSAGSASAGAAGASAGDAGSAGSAGGAGDAGSAGSAGQGASGQAGQGGGTKQAAQGCTQDSECIAGLSCLAFASHPPGQPCMEVAKVCSKTCQQGDDTSCSDLGPDFMCFQGCGDASFCGKTTSKKSIGQGCLQDAECQQGLTCIPFMSEPDSSTCKQDKKLCSKPCDQSKGDADCGGLGAGVACLGLCGGTFGCVTKQ